MHELSISGAQHHPSAVKALPPYSDPDGVRQKGKAALDPAFTALFIRPAAVPSFTIQLPTILARVHAKVPATLALAVLRATLAAVPRAALCGHGGGRVDFLLWRWRRWGRYIYCSMCCKGSRGSPRVKRPYGEAICEVLTGCNAHRGPHLGRGRCYRDHLPIDHGLRRHIRVWDKWVRVWEVLVGRIPSRR